MALFFSFEQRQDLFFHRLILSLSWKLIKSVYCSSGFAFDKCIESAIIFDDEDYSIRGIMASFGKNSSNTQILSAQRFSASRRIK